MVMMKTEKKSILEYLSQNRFVIPVFQRHYAWGEDQCTQLWEDIVAFFEGEGGR
ncbi:GmrSD restriction endonuclease domain-containing protein [Helicobacter felis]|uniref:GmrSD restriction endonuclease domain-containing protein n=1 Tax=Helicobacter felis TaxID=214 RepID=UPI0018F80D96|nr:DUF262 domain-containing protein [Helicobacter felis]